MAIIRKLRITSLEFGIVKYLSISRKSSFVIRTFIILLAIAYCLSPVSAQHRYTPAKTRILVVLDASGSMLDVWQGRPRFEIAKELLVNVVDSIQRSNPSIEFGLRIYGHQSPKVEHNCEDSKLEVPFSKQNISKIKNVLNGVKPQGWTPIAYSLYESTRDFPDEPNSKNALILITDGIESCNGDPCAVAVQMQRKRIAMKPFIIGMGLEKDKVNYFDCVGTYYDASSKSSFKNVLNVVVSQALNTTTVQVNLLNQYGLPKETDVEMTFYDAYSGEERYNFVHTMDETGQPQKLFLDPVGKYKLVVHTTPEVVVDEIELTPGKNNIIGADAPQGTLKLSISNAYAFSKTQCIIRQSGDSKILYVQDFNTNNKYLIGKYDLEILTLPRVDYKSIEIEQSKETVISVPRSGTLMISSPREAVASIFIEKNNALEKVYQYYELKGREKLSLQPGKYTFIYRPNANRQSILTEERNFIIDSGKTTFLEF